MQHLEVTFRMETPLYLAGANQSKAELRVPSIKSALRYWYRAIQPNLAEEGKVFGSMQDGQSALRLHLEYPVPMEYKCGKTGPGYLAFSLKERAYLLPSTTFCLHSALPKGKPYWKDYLASVWLLTAIGGLGSRSRRGFGSISWIGSEAMEPGLTDLIQLLPKLSVVQTLDEWIDQFMQGIHTLWSWFPGESNITHTVIHPKMKLFLCRNHFQNWEKAMSKGSRVLQEFRQGEGKKYFPRKPQQAAKQFRVSLGETQEQRYPSPFWLRIVRIGEQYVPVYFLTKTALPDPRFNTGLEMFGNHLCKEGFRLEELRS